MVTRKAKHAKGKAGVRGPRGGDLVCPEPVVDVQEPMVEDQDPVSAHRADDRYFWPADKPMPETVVKRRRDPVPCPNPECRRVRFDTGSQAVVCMHSGDDVAWFRCKACGWRFKLGVVVVGAD